MNELKRERDRKQKQEIKNLIHLVKLDKEIRRKNEEQVYQKLGFHENISKFVNPIVKPITEKLDEQEESKKEFYNKFNKQLDIALPSIEPLGIEYPKPDISYLIDHDLDNEIDIEYIEKMGFQRPSIIYSTYLKDNDKEKINKIINDVKKKYLHLSKVKGNRLGRITRLSKRDENKEEELLNQITNINTNMVKLEDYRNRLYGMIEAKKCVKKQGKSISRDVLANLLKRIQKGNKSDKLHNQSVDLIDELLIKGDITEQEKDRAYEILFPK